eukprot:7897616-Alexandrium_andersonii.AAC.1
MTPTTHKPRETLTDTSSLQTPGGVQRGKLCVSVRWRNPGLCPKQKPASSPPHHPQELSPGTGRDSVAAAIPFGRLLASSRSVWVATEADK